MCAQWRLGSDWASAQSDQSSLSAWRKLGSLATLWTHGECPYWSESLLGTQVIMLVLSWGGSITRFSLGLKAFNVFCGPNLIWMTYAMQTALKLTEDCKKGYRMLLLHTLNLNSRSQFFLFPIGFPTVEPKVGGKPSNTEISWLLFESSHEIMVLSVCCKLILQTCMPSHPVGLYVWFLVGPFTGRLCDKYHYLMSWLIFVT